MTRFVLSRLVQSVFVVVGVMLVVFVIINITGDPAAMLMPPGASEDAMAAIVALMAAVGALIAAVRIAAYDAELPVELGALIVGACISLSWMVLTDVLDPLRDLARRRD